MAKLKVNSRNELYCSECRMIQRSAAAYCSFCGAYFSNCEEIFVKNFEDEMKEEVCEK